MAEKSQREGPVWSAKSGSRYDAQGTVPRAALPRPSEIQEWSWKELIGWVGIVGCFGGILSGVGLAYHEDQQRIAQLQAAQFEAEKLQQAEREATARQMLGPPDYIWTVPAAEFPAPSEKLMIFYDGDSHEVFAIDREGNVQLGAGVTPDAASLEFWRMVRLNTGRSCAGQLTKP